MSKQKKPRREDLSKPDPRLRKAEEDVEELLGEVGRTRIPSDAFEEELERIHRKGRIKGRKL